MNLGFTKGRLKYF